MPLKDLRKTLRELKSTPAKAKSITKKLGLTAAEFEEMERIMKSAQKMVDAVEEEAKIRVEDLRTTYREIHEGERMAERAKSELVEANLARLRGR
jgi:RNA polymerase primary sigma factor